MLRLEVLCEADNLIARLFSCMSSLLWTPHRPRTRDIRAPRASHTKTTVAVRRALCYFRSCRRRVRNAENMTLLHYHSERVCECECVGWMSPIPALLRTVVACATVTDDSELLKRTAASTHAHAHTHDTTKKKRKKCTTPVAVSRRCT